MWTLVNPDRLCPLPPLSTGLFFSQIRGNNKGVTGVVEFNPVRVFWVGVGNCYCYRQANCLGEGAF